MWQDWCENQIVLRTPFDVTVLSALHIVANVSARLSVTAADSVNVVACCLVTLDASAAYRQRTWQRVFASEGRQPRLAISAVDARILCSLA